MCAYPSSHRISPGLAPQRIAVLIVTSEPGRALVDMVECLVEARTAAILVVDDGSGAPRQWVLEKIASEPTVHLLRHGQTLGRGTALKTGMEYFLNHLQHYTGLVTADGAGRPAAEDILRMAAALNTSPRLAVIGIRDFDKRTGAVQSKMPRAALLGNRVTALLFRVLTGISLRDTQNGVRALPTALLPRLLALPGSRFEFEMAMLLEMARGGQPLAERHVGTHSSTLTTDGEFRMVADSWRVMRALVASPYSDTRSEAAAATQEAEKQAGGRAAEPQARTRQTR